MVTKEKAKALQGLIFHYGMVEHCLKAALEDLSILGFDNTKKETLAMLNNVISAKKQLVIAERK